MDTKVLQKAIDTFGTKPQLIKYVEELAEVQQAVCKLINDGHELRLLQLAEEIDDKKIVEAQLMMIYPALDSFVNQMINKKMDRLEKRLRDIEETEAYTNEQI
jgi:hypothetical protein